MDYQRLWQAVLGEMEVDVSPASFRTWFSGTGIISQEDGRVVVAVPNPYTKERLERLYGAEIRESLRKAGVTVRSIEYRVSAKGIPSAALEATLSTKPGSAAGRAVAPGQTQAKLVSAPHPTLNPSFTFESFVVGDSNDVAYASAQAVSRYPGQKYGCLFLYGGVGLGKTHLMQAIGNEILRRDPSKSVRYVTSEQFTNEFTDSLKSKSTKRFASLYRNLDVLIVDDIQFLGNKEKTQEEFFHTFNTLQQLGKQVVLSSDRPPKAIPNLEDRLSSRFSGGMQADIQRPDLETRVAIIGHKATERGMELSHELVEFLARHFQQNIREVEGALTQLSVVCEHHNTDPSVDVMKRLLGASTSPRKRSLTPRIVLEKTSALFELPVSEIIGPKRDKDIVRPRQIAMYLMHEDIGLSYPKVGLQMGGRDHSTVMHSVRKIERSLELDHELQADLARLREQINA